MGIQYHIDTAKKLVITVVEGTITDIEMVRQQQKLAKDSLFKPDFNQLVDASQVVDIKVSDPGMRLAAIPDPFGEGARRAIVVNSKEGEKLAHMYKGLRVARKDEIEIFYDLAEAKTWLENT